MGKVWLGSEGFAVYCRVGCLVKGALFSVGLAE